MVVKFFLFFLLTVIALQASTKFQEATELYNKHEYATAFQLFKKLAIKESDADAAYMLAYMYEHGEGTPKDAEKSKKWYKTSSQAYHHQDRLKPNTEIDKETEKLYKGINKSLDKETLNTIKQYVESMYSIKAHNANYFLPISYRGSGEYPTTNGHTAQTIETEFQFSVKYDFYANLFNLSEVYSFGYTQRSFWQLYEESAFFRETNYNPEVFITVPVGHMKHFDYFKALRLSFEHKSNGRGGEEERSWNYAVGTFYFQTWFFFTELQLWHNVGNLKYNKDLMDYMGYGEIEFIVPYKKSLFKLMSRNSFSSKRATELSYSYPLSRSKDIFLYLKGFSGYGESLIDYNHKLNKIGIGFSISR
jgi:phospholipase A1